MKVVKVINSFSPGGAEILVKDLSKLLKSKGIDVEIWAVGQSSDKNFEQYFIKELIMNGIKFKSFNKKPHSERFKIIFSLREEISKIKPDIIHAHCVSPAFFTWVSCLGIKIPLVQTIHSTKVDYVMFQKYFFKRKFQKFIAISQKVEDILIKKIGISPERIVKIYNGIDLNKFKGDLSNSKLEEGSYLKLLSIGRLTEEKDHETLIKSIYFLKKKYYKEIELPFKLFIVGEGKLKERLMWLVKNLELEGKIEILGNRTDIPDLLNNAHIFILSSKWEGFPLTVLEAMASKLPIISTNVGSVNEIIEDGKEGILVPQESPEELADAIYLLSRYPLLRKKLSENAYRKVRGNFSIEICAEEHLKLYNQLLKDSV